VGTVAVPAACLALLWVIGAGCTLGSAMAHRGLLWHHEEMAEGGLAVLGLIIVFSVVALTGSFARRLSRDVTGLAATAQRLAGQPGPSGQSEQPGPSEQPGAAAGAHRPTTEIARADAAITSLQHAAVTATASEVGLRNGLREVFVSMARRNQSLLQRQLRLIDALEQKATDPAALADLFSLDHLTTRMRRNAESLTILSGAAPGRAWREPVPVIDVIRGAMAEVEDYKRVSVRTTSEDSVAGAAAADMIHLLAELIENATLFSPSGTRVEVRAGQVANGFAVEIDDRGLGVEPGQLAEINSRLANPPDFDLANSDRLGLFVGAKLAARHGVKVMLRTSPYGGTTAIVLMPDDLIVPASAVQPGGGRPDGPVQALDLKAGTEALVGRRSAEPLAAERPAGETRLPRRTRDGQASAAAPAARTRTPSSRTPGSRTPAGHPDDGGHRVLPRRTRQASLSPHLRDTPQAGSSGPGLPPSEVPAPDHARNFASSLQSGWLRGRQEGPDTTKPGTTRPDTAQQDPTPHTDDAQGPLSRDDS
jgi:signal transduction histidine kinase